MTDRVRMANVVDWDAFTSAVRRCVDADVYRMARLESHEPAWKFAEYTVAVLEGGTLFMSLPTRIRRMIHGGGTSADRGVDVVTPDGGLIQVKWYKDGSCVGNDAVARLNNIAEAFIRGGGTVPRRTLAVKAGDRINENIVGLDVVEVKYYDDSSVEEAKTIAKMALLSFGKVRRETRPALNLTEVFNALQRDVAGKLTGLFEAGRNNLSAELPTGSGKSYIIARLVAYHNLLSPSLPALVVVPRIDIARQHVRLFRENMFGELGGPRGESGTIGADKKHITGKIANVSDGRNWPDCYVMSATKIIVLSGQSAHKVPKDFRASVVVYDEAHVYYGRKLIDARVSRPATYNVSATMPSSAETDVDVRVSYGEAVDLGIICDAVFVFVKFSREPTFEDYADHLLKNERHGAVLACFNRQWRAREFARVYNEKRPTGSQPAESYVSGDPRESLDRFRDGATRVLCVVTRVELGVNVHVCDTVLMVDPWDSNSRLRQLCGRATRHWPTKKGYYSVLFGVGSEEQESATVARMVDVIHKEIGELCPENVEEIIDRVEVVVGGADQEDFQREKFESLTSLRVNIYDSFGRHLTSESQRLRLKYERDRMELLGRDVRTYAEFQRLRARLPVLSLPEDPPDSYIKVFSLNFPWDAYLGRPELEYEDFLDLLVKAVAEVIAGGEISAQRIWRNPSKETYRLVQKKTTVSLPEQPAIQYENYRQIFRDARAKSE